MWRHALQGIAQNLREHERRVKLDQRLELNELAPENLHHDEEQDGSRVLHSEANQGFLPNDVVTVLEPRNGHALSKHPQDHKARGLYKQET